MTRPYSKSQFETLYTFPERNSRSFNEQEHLKRPLKLTNLSLPEVIINDNSAVRKSSILTYQQPNPKSYRISISTSTNGIKPMDFRPLITHGRRKFSAIPSSSSSSSMVITKKKSPSPMNSLLSNQKPLTRSIPVDIINNNMAIVVSSMIPSSSLSYSSSYSSSSSTSTSSTNVGTVFLPIEVTKSQNNKNNNNSIRYSNISIINEGQRDYHYVQNQIDQQERFKFQKSRHRFLLDDIDVDESTRISSSSSNGGEGNNYQSTALMDSHVLRLIRRYDPVSPHPTGIRSRGSLENTRNVWHTVDSKSVVPQSLDSSAFLSNRSFTTAYEDERPTKQPSVSRLQRQQAFYEPDPPPPPLPPPPPPPPPPPSNSLRPILRYSSSRARSEFIVQPYQNESPVVDVPPFPNESAATYQPSTPTGSRRVCSALSKSAWDLRLQQEQLPIRPPSPIVINQQQERESYRPVLGRSKSSIAINYVHDEDEHRDDFDEISAPITENGSYVEKLKRLFVTKSPFDYTNPSLTNQHRNDSVDSNLNRQLNRNNNINNISSPLVRTTPNRNSIESEQRIINDSTTSSYNQTPVLRHQRTMDSLETVNRPTSGSFMPAPDLSYESYRFSRPNDINSPTIRSRNIAKVEPYSINTNAVRPLYQSSSVQPNAMIATTAIPSKARISLNSMENTPTNSSTSSSHGGILRHSNLQHSDFLMPNPTYSTTPLQPISNSLSYTTPPVLLSESLSHGSLHQLPAVNSLSYNGRTTGLISSTNNSRQIYPVTTQTDFHPSMQTSSRLGHSTNLLPSTAYHYRPSATTIITNSRQQQQQLDIPTRSTIIEQQQQQQDEAANSGSQQHQSRRRFQRRKQIKRSKSVDAYHDASMANNDFNKSSHHQRSTSRENLARENLSLSSSSSSASLTADIERVNRSALLRYKSLDSMTFNNQKLNSNDKNKNNPNHRRAFSKPAEFDFDSDDSVCGIPKPRKAIGR